MKLAFKIIAAIFVLLALQETSFAFESYYYPLKDGKKVKIVDVFVSTSVSNNKKMLIVRYIPVDSSPDMWKHIVEMFDVASWFASDAKEQHLDKIGVSPQFNMKNPSDNMIYEYSVHDDTPVSADWRLEWQPWFHDKKG